MAPPDWNRSEYLLYINNYDNVTPPKQVQFVNMNADTEAVYTYDSSFSGIILISAVEYTVTYDGKFREK